MAAVTNPYAWAFVSRFPLLSRQLSFGCLTSQLGSTEVGSWSSVVQEEVSRNVQEEGGLEANVPTGTADLCRVAADNDGKQQSKGFEAA